MTKMPYLWKSMKGGLQSGYDNSDSAACRYTALLPWDEKQNLKESCGWPHGVRRSWCCHHNCLNKRYNLINLLQDLNRKGLKNNKKNFNKYFDKITQLLSNKKDKEELPYISDVN